MYWIIGFFSLFDLWLPSFFVILMIKYVIKFIQHRIDNFGLYIFKNIECHSVVLSYVVFIWVVDHFF